jgi:hypothetical protein
MLLIYSTLSHPQGMPLAAEIHSRPTLKRMEGFPTVEEFMDRRLTPTMRTCEAMAGRQEALAQRIANTTTFCAPGSASRRSGRTGKSCNR